MTFSLVTVIPKSGITENMGFCSLTPVKIAIFVVFFQRIFIQCSTFQCLTHQSHVKSPNLLIFLVPEVGGILGDILTVLS